MKENYQITEEFMNNIWIFYEANLTPRTRKEYFTVLKSFVKVTGNDPLHLTQEATDRFYKDLVQRLKENRLSYTTALMRVSVMRSICEFIRYHQNSHGIDYTNFFSEIVLNDIDKTIQNENLPDENELNSLLQLSQSKSDDTAFLLFSLVMKCGLTTGEICSLNMDYIEIDSEQNLYIHFPAKGRNTRTIKLPKDITELMTKYIDDHDIFDGAILLNKRKNRLTLRDAERILIRYLNLGEQEDLIHKRFTLQMMRHAAFKYMLKGGASEEEVAKYGGITTKWMSRYRQVSATEITSDAIDYSIISINKR